MSIKRSPVDLVAWTGRRNPQTSLQTRFPGSHQDWHCGRPATAAESLLTFFSPRSVLKTRTQPQNQRFAAKETEDAEEAVTGVGSLTSCRADCAA